MHASTQQTLQRIGIGLCVAGMAVLWATLIVRWVWMPAANIDIQKMAGFAAIVAGAACLFVPSHSGGLYVFHRVLVCAAIIFDYFFTAFCANYFDRNQDYRYLVWAVASTLAALGFVGYLVYFTRKTQRLQRVLRGQLLCPHCDYDLRGSLSRDDTTHCPECGAPINDDLRRRAATV